MFLKMLSKLLMGTKNSLKKLLILLVAVTAFGAVGQAWGMEDSDGEDSETEETEKIEEVEIVDEGEIIPDKDLRGEIKDIYFLVIKENDEKNQVFDMYKIEMGAIPAVIRSAIISHAFHFDFLEKSSLMISYPMSQDYFEKIDKLLKSCKKICSFSKPDNKNIKISEISKDSEIDLKKAETTVSQYMTQNTLEALKTRLLVDLINVYLMTDDFYEKNIINPLTDDINLPIFGVAKNGKIYFYNGNDANKRLNFRKEKNLPKNKTLKPAYFVRGFIDNNNENLSPDFTCVGEVTTDIKGKEVFTRDENFDTAVIYNKPLIAKEGKSEEEFKKEVKEELEALSNFFKKKLNEQHKKDVRDSIDVYLISKDEAGNSATLHFLEQKIPVPLKMALVKKAISINNLIIPVEGDKTKKWGSFCVFPAIDIETFKSIEKALFSSFSKEIICSLKNDGFRIPIKKEYEISSTSHGKPDNYDCIDEKGLKSLLQEALGSKETSDAYYYQENVINPFKRQDKPLLARDKINGLYLYTKENNSNNWFEKLKLIMQEKFIKTSKEEEIEEKGFFLMKNVIGSSDSRFRPVGKIEGNGIKWDENFKKNWGRENVVEQKLLENLQVKNWTDNIIKNFPIERQKKEEQKRIEEEKLRVEKEKEEKLRVEKEEAEKLKREQEEKKVEQQKIEEQKKIEKEAEQKKIEEEEKLRKEDKIEKNEKKLKPNIKQLGEQFKRNIEQFRKEKLRKEKEKLRKEKAEKKRKEKEEEEKLRKEKEKEENLALCSFIWSQVKSFFGGLTLGLTQSYLNNNTTYFKNHENISDTLFSIGSGAVTYHCLSKQIKTEFAVPIIPMLTVIGWVCGRYHNKELKGYVKSILINPFFSKK